VSTGSQPSLFASFRQWWSGNASRHGVLSTLRTLLSEIWDFVRESTPERRRRRYGDVEYDWNFPVDTTSATVSFRNRLLGVFHSAYQPTEPALFDEIMGAIPIEDPSGFVFVDLGSGKGRTLLIHPFPEAVLEAVIDNLNQSLLASPRPVFVVYVNPLLESLVLKTTGLKRIGGTQHYAIYQYAP
jgi:hypothetical protein